jgi:hypothetical protein
MAGVHAGQAILVILLANDFSLPVTTSFLRFDDATQQLEQGTEVLLHVHFAGLIAVFFALSAVAHAYLGWFANKQYRQDLKRGINPVRWYEYSLSASIMMVAIAMLAGVYDLSSLIMIFTLTGLMNLLGLMMEVHNQTTKRTNWLSYNLGIIAGIVPWVVVGLYFMGAAIIADGTIPTFVYWIYGTIFLAFNSFALNMILQYKGIGKWKDYRQGERVYIILSIVAKTLLAWQVFAGTLQPA